MKRDEKGRTYEVGGSGVDLERVGLAVAADRDIDGVYPVILREIKGVVRQGTWIWVYIARICINRTKYHNDASINTMLSAQYHAFGLDGGIEAPKIGSSG